MLKIDLLPKSFRIAHINKLMLVGLVVLLALVGAFWFSTGATVKGQTAAVEKQIAEVQSAAAEFDRVTAELTQKKAELQPIADKVKFVEDADKCGAIYWELYDKIKRYIWSQAENGWLAVSAMLLPS